METESGLMRAVKVQKAALPCRTVVPPPLLPSVQSIVIPIATGSTVGVQGWTRLSEGDFCSDSHLENHHSGTNGIGALSQKHNTISPQGWR